MGGRRFGRGGRIFTASKDDGSSSKCTARGAVIRRSLLAFFTSPGAVETAKKVDGRRENVTRKTKDLTGGETRHSKRRGLDRK